MLLQERIETNMDLLLDSPTRVYGTYDVVSKDRGFLEGRETQLREERNTLIETLPLKDEKEIGDVVLAVNNQGRTNQVYARVVELIKDKTNAFREYEEAGIRQALLWNLADAEFGGKSIRWRYSLPDSTLGRYHPVRGEIQMNADIPTKHGVLFSLAKQGTLNLPARAAAHDHTHSRQVFTSRKKTSYDSHPELHEAQAFRMGDEGVAMSTAGDLVNWLLKPGAYPDLARPKLLHAVEAVDKLSALKTPLWEITDLVRRPGKWDERRGQYERIQRAIHRKVNQLDLDEEGFDKLVRCYALESQIQHLKVMHIAQTELKNAAIPYVA